LLFVGGCVGVSAVVSFGFAVGTGARVGLGDIVGASLINTCPVWEGVDDEAAIEHA
jgi:hypothetical protein